jgi:hypothetical protein
MIEINNINLVEDKIMVGKDLLKKSLKLILMTKFL